MKSLQIESVVIATHQEVDTIVTHEVDEAVLLGNATGPDVGPEMLDGFGLSDALKGVAHHRFDELEDPEGNAAIGLNPEL